MAHDQEQAKCRIHRVGQKLLTYTFELHMIGSLAEENIWNMQERRKSLTGCAIGSNVQVDKSGNLCQADDEDN